MTTATKLRPCIFCGHSYANVWKHQQNCKKRNGRELPKRSRASEKNPKTPCRFCGKLLCRPGRHEPKCPMGDGTSIDRRSAHLDSIKSLGAAKNRVTAQIRRDELFALLDLSKPLGPQMDTLNVSRRSQNEYLHKWRNEGKLPQLEPGRMQHRRLRGKTAELDDQAREIFKNDLRLDRPLATQLRELGIEMTKSKVNALAVRARTLGLIGPEDRFSYQDPLRPKAEPKKRERKHTKEFYQKDNERRRLKRLAERPAPNAVLREKPALPKQKQNNSQRAKYVVIESGLNDPLKKVCRYGCGYEGNAFRVGKHEQGCAFHDEESSVEAS